MHSKHLLSSLWPVASRASRSSSALSSNSIAGTTLTSSGSGSSCITPAVVAGCLETHVQKGTQQLWQGIVRQRTSGGTSLLGKQQHPQIRSCRLLSSSPSKGQEAEQLGIAVRKARWLSLPVGAVAGLFGSVVGVGGGVVIVPLIVNACKTIPQRLVSGTSLAAVVSTAVASTATYWQSGFVDATSALLISTVAMLAAPWGARYTAKLDCMALRRVLGYFLLAVAPLVPLKAFLLKGRDGQQDAQHAQVQQMQPGNEPQQAQERGSRAQHARVPREASENEVEGAKSGATGPDLFTLERAATMCEDFWQGQKTAVAALPAFTLITLCVTGAVAGFASGLLGIGGGTIVTPLLALAMPYGQATVLGTSLLAMIPPSLAGLAQHQRMGNVDWRMAGGLALGTALGGKLGSTFAVQAPAGVLEGAFTLGMLLLGRKTLLSAKR